MLHCAQGVLVEITHALIKAVLKYLDNSELISGSWDAK
jgi:hypothetical protein